VFYLQIIYFFLKLRDSLNKIRAPYFPPPYRSQRVLQLRLSCQVAGGGGVRSPNGEVVGDRITGGSAKKILLIVQRDQILLARSYFLCEDALGRMSM